MGASTSKGGVKVAIVITQQRHRGANCHGYCENMGNRNNNSDSSMYGFNSVGDNRNRNKCDRC